MTWSDVAVAAAFVLGAVAGTTATVRVTKHVLQYLRREGDGSDTRSR
jgi:hypothetical protein